MAKKDPEPAWQTALFLGITFLTILLALPAAMDGRWLTAGAVFVGLLVVEIAILLGVRATRRRRARRTES